jgi:glycosyltransferase involved in cell wall biosynthesis
LESIRLQSAVECEVLVVNDGGAPLAGELDEARKALEITLIEPTANLGPAAARNLALARAEGEYIAFLDDDDLFGPGQLQTCLEACAKTGSDAAYVRAFVATSQLRNEEVPAAMDGLRTHLDFGVPFVADFLDVMNFVPPSALAYRNPRDPRARFDPDLPVVEDWDMWLRLRRDLGFGFTYADTSACIYHRLASADSLTLNSAQQHRDMQKFVRCYEKVYARWTPSAGARVQQYRGSVLGIFNAAAQRLVDGGKVSPRWYERVLGRMFADFSAGREAPSVADLSLAFED